MDRLISIEHKILASDALCKRAIAWRLKSETLVFTNGCFDLIHKGHVMYLAQAASLGTKLIVGLNSDASVKKLNKGPSRPFQDETSRSIVLASMQCIDAVCLFDEETPSALIELIRPDVLVKGGDWKPEQIAGSEFVLSTGGRVLSLPFIEGYSTTAIEQKILYAKS